MQTSDEAVAEPDGIVKCPGWLRLHVWTVLGLLAMVIAGMAYSLWWDPVFHHTQIWRTPPDIWGTFRVAHYVGWGTEGMIYSSNASFVTFPGIAVLLAPVAMLQGALHLSQSFPWYLAKPTEWFILGPAELLCGAFLLFPLDALATRLGVTTKRRILLVWLDAALIWPMVALWGHPEDCLAMAFGIYGLLAGFDRSWVRSGAFFGLALVMQPLIILILPIALAYVPTRKLLPFVGEVALPSFLLLLAPLVQNWGPTTRVLLNQPNDPLVDHPTPLLSMAPVLHAGHFIVVNVARFTTLPDGRRSISSVPTRVLTGEIVAAGPGRLIALVLACAIGLWVAKRKPTLLHVVWCAAIALSLRCAFESVMVPYYLIPGLALVLVVAANARSVRLILTTLAIAACVSLSYVHTGPWVYYSLVTGFLFLAIVSTWTWHGVNSRSGIRLPLDDDAPTVEAT